MAAFYGLRRGEIVGLKWQAINFQNQTLTIQHTVIPVSYEGKLITVVKDRAKNKSSHRTLPLVPAFQELLLRLLEEQQRNKLLYKKSYSDEYADYICVNKLGSESNRGILRNISRLFCRNTMCAEFGFTIFGIVAPACCWQTVWG